MKQIKITSKGSRYGLMMILTILMIARFACTAFSNLFFMSMGFIFIYGVGFSIILFFSIRYLSRREFMILLCLLAYLIDVMLVTILPQGDIFNTQAFNAYVLFFLYMIYLYLKRITIINRKTIFWIALAGVSFTCLYSIPQLVIDPMLSRKMATGIVEEDGINALGATGGFDTVYGVLLIICMLLFIRDSTNSATIKALSVVLMCIYIIFLIMASYGTTLVLLVALFVMWLFQKNRIMATIIIGLALLAFVYHEPLGEKISDWSNQISYSTVLGNKIDDIGNIIRTGESAGTLSGDDGRLARMQWSLEAFEQYPLFGAYNKAGVRIGFHSEIMDSLGRFGLVGTIPLLLFLFLVFRDIYVNMKTEVGRKCCVFCAILYATIMVLNPSMYTQQILPIFIFLPLFELYGGKEDVRNV